MILTQLQKNNDELEKILKEKTDIHKTRIYMIIVMVTAILRLSRVNLKKIAPLVNPSVTQETNYRRLNKFFQFFTFDNVVLAKFLSSFLPNDEWILTMDRTNWKFGKTHINILMLAVAYKGRAIPIIWYMLEKETKNGNSNYKDRIRIIQKFIDIFGKERIKVLTADREFIGKDWFEWLKRNEVPFVIRIKNNHKIKTAKRFKRADRLFCYLKTLEYSIYGKKLEIYGYEKLSLIALKTKDEYLILATNSDPYIALDNYRKRWEIETMFSAFKTRGFSLKQTHMSDNKKIHTLVGILSIAFIWSYAIGEWYNELKPIKTLKHGRKEKSIFLHGLEFIAEVFLNYEHKKDDLKAIYTIFIQRLMKIGDY